MTWNQIHSIGIILLSAVVAHYTVRIVLLWLQ